MSGHYDRQSRIDPTFGKGIKPYGQGKIEHVVQTLPSDKCKRRLGDANDDFPCDICGFGTCKHPVNSELSPIKPDNKS